METPKAKGSPLSSAEPVPEHGKLLETRHDGTRVLIGGERDTVESLFRLAYPKEAGTAEDLRQLATWLYLYRGGLPEEGARLELPSFHRLNKDLEPVHGRFSATQCVAANEWAAFVVKNEVTLTKNKQIRQEHDAQAKAVSKAPAVQGAFAPKRSAGGVRAAGAGRVPQVVRKAPAAARHFERGHSQADSEDLGKTRSELAASRGAAGTARAAPEAGPAALGLVATVRRKLEAAVKAVVAETRASTSTSDFLAFGDELTARLSDQEWKALLADAHDGWRLQEALQGVIEASGLNSLGSDRAERWAANAVIDALVRRGIVDGKDPLAVVRTELAGLRGGLTEAKRGFPFGQRGATGERLVDRLLMAAGIRDHSWQKLLVATPDLALLDDEIAETLAATGLDGVLNAGDQIRGLMVRAVAEEAILTPVENALHAHLNAAALRLDALARHPEIAVAEARMLMSLPLSMAEAHLEAIGLRDDSTVELLGPTRNRGQLEATADELAPRLAALAKQRLAGLLKLQGEVGRTFKNRNDLLGLAPELTRQVVDTRALGWDPHDYPFDDLEPTNAAQSAILAELERWDDSEARAACLGIEILGAAATGGLGVVAIAADAAVYGVQTGLEAYARMLTKQALATAHLARQDDVRAVLGVAAVAFVAGKAVGIGARFASEKVVEGITRELAKKSRDVLAETLGALLHAGLEKGAEKLEESRVEASLEEGHERSAEPLVIEASQAMGAALLAGRESELRAQWSALAPRHAGEFDAVFAAYCALYGQELPRILVAGRLASHFEAFAGLVARARR